LKSRLRKNQRALVAEFVERLQLLVEARAKEKAAAMLAVLMPGGRR
jgi:hypothetical protein